MVYWFMGGLILRLWMVWNSSLLENDKCILVFVTFWISDTWTFSSKLVTNSASSARFFVSISSFLECLFSTSNVFSKSYIFRFASSFTWSSINVASLAVFQRFTTVKCVIIWQLPPFRWHTEWPEPFVDIYSSKVLTLHNCWRTMIFNFCFLNKDLWKKHLLLLFCWHMA